MAANMKYHDIVNLFPKMVGEERESLKKDIKAHGVREPALTWGGKVIDGRNRIEVCEELGVECPVKEFEGTESEALDYAVSLNLRRRHLDSGQMSVIAVRAGKLKEKYEKKRDAREKRRQEGGAEEDEAVEEGEEGGGDVADEVAKEMGTNRTYMFKAKALVASDPDLADKVQNGEMKLTQAEKEARRRRSGGDQAEAQEAKQEEPKILDGLGQEVPEKFHDVFRARDDFRAVSKLIRMAKQQVAENLVDGKAGAFVHGGEINASLDDANREVKYGLPYTLCPHCEGGPRGCEHCKRKGWVNKATYDAWHRQQESKGGGNGELKRKGKKAEKAEKVEEAQPAAAE
jgi:hypothetical protein